MTRGFWRSMNLIKKYSFTLDNPYTLTQIRGPILLLLFSLLSLSFYLDHIEYRQFSLSLLVLLPGFVFNHFFSSLQTSPKDNIIPLSLDFLTTFFLLFINGGHDNPLYLVLLFHIFLAPFYLGHLTAFIFSMLCICAFMILPFSPFHFQLHLNQPFADLHFPFVAISISGLIFWMVASWFVLEIKKLNHLLQKSLKLQYSADRYRSLGLLSAGVCHELGTPLHTLNMRTRQLQRKILSQEDRNNEMLKDLEVILRNADQCSDSIKKLNSQIHNPESYQEQLKNTSCIASEAISKGIHLFQDQFDLEQNIQIEYKKSPESEGCRVDLSQSHLTQQIIDLLLNSKEAKSTKILIELRKSLLDQDYVEIDLIDNGIGFSSEVFKHLGQPFVTTKERGSGLGLYHLKNLIEYIDGQLIFDHSKKEGAHLTISLPQG